MDDNALQQRAIDIIKPLIPPEMVVGRLGKMIPDIQNSPLIFPVVPRGVSHNREAD